MAGLNRKTFVWDLGKDLGVLSLLSGERDERDAKSKGKPEKSTPVAPPTC
jgi:hypothetical protein